MRFRTLRSPASILVAITTYTALGVIACAIGLLTQDLGWITHYFNGPATLMSLWFSGFGLALAITSMRAFDPCEPMHTAWKLYAYSAACDVTSVFLTQVLGADTWLNPVRGFSFWTRGLAGAARDAGAVFNGTPRFALLAGALVFALRAYRGTGLLAKLRRSDQVILSAMGGYLVYEMFEVISGVKVGHRPTLVEVIGWPTDPLLWFLILEALLLWRSAQEMGGGRIARCWKSVSVGVMLIAAGDLLLMAERLGYLRWPYTTITYYVWLPAAAAFALAPAFQVDAVEHATEPARRPLS